MNDKDLRTTFDLTRDLTRRRFLQGTALAGFSAFLAACSSNGGSAAPTAAGSAAANVPTPPPASATPVSSPTPVPPTICCGTIAWKRIPRSFCSETPLAYLAMIQSMRLAPA